MDPTAKQPLRGTATCFRTEIDVSGLCCRLEPQSAAERESQAHHIPMFRISNDVRSTQTQDGSILLDVQHGQMFCLNLVGSKIFEFLARAYDEYPIAQHVATNPA